MKTDDLIRALAADHAPTGLSLRTAVTVALAVGIAVAAIQFLWLLGPRPGAFAALTSWRFCFKFVYTILLAASAAYVCTRSILPLAEIDRRMLLPLSLAPVLLICAVGVELSVQPQGAWASKAMGGNALMCLIWVPLLSIAPFLALMFTLRRGAPVSPAFTGAIAGLIAAAIGSSLYASHCPDDSPLFLGLWHTLAMLSVVLMGTLSGRWLLRW